MLGLGDIGIFAGLSKEVLVQLEALTVVRTFPKNAYILNEGGVADSFSVIQSGRVKVFISDPGGREIVLREQWPGEYFGELSLFDGGSRSASVATLEKSTLWIFGRADFLRLINQYPLIGRALLREMAFRIRALTGSVKNLALLDVYGRVSRLLREMGRKQEDGKYVIEAKLTQQGIADRVGASRERVARVLKDLKQGGYLWQEPGRIVISEHMPVSY